MTESLPVSLKQALSDKLLESLHDPPGQATRREVCGATGFAGKATAIVGMRRVGKTTFAHQLRREKLAAGIPPDHLPYLNFEDERLIDLSAAQLGYVLEEYARLVPDSQRRGPVTWCFDEIQVVPGWERFVRRLLDREHTQVIITGSSAALLSREIATALRGRAWAVPLYPFSFSESLLHRGLPLPKNVMAMTPNTRARVERAFGEWLQIGGFPEAQGLNTSAHRQLLLDYVDVATLRDVVERHQVSNVLGLRWLVRHLLGNAAALFSVEKFYAALKSQGVAISKDTVHQLLLHLQDCFLVRMVWMDASSERQRMVNPRKGYPVDCGLIPVFDRNGRANLGHALETAVLIELERRRAEVTYVRTPSGKEVDFLARSPDGKLELIQVCADASEPKTAERELRALLEAKQIFPDAELRLLTLRRDGAPSQVPAGVEVEAAYTWMLR